MPIDTAEKRRSAAGVPFLPLGPAVTPTAAKDVEWRAQATWGYSGIVPAAAAAAVVGGDDVRLGLKQTFFLSSGLSLGH